MWSYVILCDPRLSTCYGCSQPIRSAGVHVPPPADLVVVTKMRRDFVVAGEKRPGKLGNVYFHAHMSCIRSKLAHFLPSLLTVKTHVRQLLTPLHRQHLIDSLGFSAWINISDRKRLCEKFIHVICPREINECVTLRDEKSAITTSW